MLPTVTTVIATLASLMVLDSVWLWFNTGLYRAALAQVQGSPLQLNWLGMALSYVCVSLLLLFVVAPRLRAKVAPNSLCSCACEGGLVGLLTYGVYNFTNLATLSRYPLWLAVLDTTWGGTLFTLVSVVMSRTV